MLEIRIVLYVVDWGLTCHNPAPQARR